MTSILRRIYNDTTGKIIIDMIFVVLPTVFLVRTFLFGLYQVPSESMETTFLKGERFFADKLSYWFKKPQRGDIVSINDPEYTYSDDFLTRLAQKYLYYNVSLWTKRIIAIEGDHIRGTIENGKPVIYLNGEKLDETGYVNQYPIICARVKPITLSVGEQTKTIETQFKSFDPNLPWDKQLFYKIDPKNIVIYSLLHRSYPNMPYVPDNALIKMPNTPKEEGRDIFDLTLGKNKYFLRGDNRRASYDSSNWGPIDLEFINGKIVYRILSIDTDESWILFDILKNPIAFFKKIRWSRCFNFIK